MKSGDVAIVTLDPTVGHEQAKTRPCVILQCNPLNRTMGTTIIAPITLKEFDLPYPNIVKLDCSFFKKSSSVKVEQLRCIDKSRIVEVIGRVSDDELNKLKEAVKVVFDI